MFRKSEFVIMAPDTPRLQIMTSKSHPSLIMGVSYGHKVRFSNPHHTLLFK